MQHLDEGTIHSWLDGALSAEEGARVEAHVAECPRCAAGVAEARGFIAASSRILTALDHVPRGVVPATAPVKWYNRAAWRGAAAVLVVAVGSLVVVRNNDRSEVAASATAANATDSQTTVTQGQVVPASPVKPTAEADFSGKPTRARPASHPNVVAQYPARDENPGAVTDANPVAIQKVAGAVTAQSSLSSRGAGATVMDAAVEQPPLKVVGTPRVIGAKVTLYEVAPGDTVTFTEPSNIQLETAVVTAMSSPAEPPVRRSMEKSAATVTTQAAVAAPASPSLQVEVANGVTTITWPDATTGNMLRLSGRMPVERLKQIKLRIERERAAAAAKKKP